MPVVGTAAIWSSLRIGLLRVVSVPAATFRAVGKKAPGCWLQVPSFEERRRSLGGWLSKATST
jgi:hypothetical protein